MSEQTIKVVVSAGFKEIYFLRVQKNFTKCIDKHSKKTRVFHIDPPFLFQIKYIGNLSAQESKHSLAAFTYIK